MHGRYEPVSHTSRHKACSSPVPVEIRRAVVAPPHRTRSPSLLVLVQDPIAPLLRARDRPLSWRRVRLAGPITLPTKLDRVTSSRTDSPSAAACRGRRTNGLLASGDAHGLLRCLLACGRICMGAKPQHAYEIPDDERGKVMAGLPQNYPRARRIAASNRSFSLSHRACSLCDLFSSASTSASIAAARFACSCSALSRAACALSTAC
jgi:hypothetical protein